MKTLYDFPTSNIWNHKAKQFTLILFLISLSINAQLTQVNVQGLSNNPSKGVVYGDYLYFTRYTADKISRIDLTQTNPTLEDIFSDISLPYGLVLDGDELYIKSAHPALAVFKADLSISNPSATLFYQGEYQPNGVDPSNMVIIDDDLYLARYATNEIVKINTTDQNPQETVVVSGLDRPRDMELIGNYLYISERDAGKISRININDANPVTVDVVTGLDTPNGMALRNNYLYVTDADARKIHRLDITESSIISEEYIDTPSILASEVLFYNDTMYIINFNGHGGIYKYEDSALTPDTCEIGFTNNLYISFPQVYGQSFMTECGGILDYVELKVHPTSGDRTVPANTLHVYEGSTVSGTPIYSESFGAFTVPSGQTSARIDITGNFSVLSNEQYTFTVDVGNLIVEGANGDAYPVGQAFADGISYSTTDFGFGVGIVENTLSAENLTTTDIKLHPNPASEFISLTGNTNLSDYVIYDILGKAIKKGTYLTKEPISIQNLERGMYFLKFDNHETLKFLKN